MTRVVSYLAARLAFESGDALARMAGVTGKAHAMRFAFGAALLAGAALTTKLTRDFNKVQEQTTLTALATMDYAHAIKTVRNQQFDLAQSFGITAEEAGNLKRQIVELGFGDQFGNKFNENLERSAASLQVLGGVAGDEAAKGLAKFSQLTARSDAEAQQYMDTIETFSSQFLIASRMIAAGPQGLLDFMRVSGRLGPLNRMTRTQQLALAAGLAHIDENSRAAFATSVNRLLTMSESDLAAALQGLGFGPKDVARLVRQQTTDPFAFLTQFMQKLNERRQDPNENIGRLVRELGLTDLRYSTGFGGLVGGAQKTQQVYARILEEEKARTRDQLVLYRDMNVVQGEFFFQVRKLGQTWLETGNIAARVFVPALQAIAIALTAIGETLNKNPWLVYLLTAGALGGLGRVALMGKGMVGAGLGFGARMAARGIGFLTGVSGAGASAVGVRGSLSFIGRALATRAAAGGAGGLLARGGLAAAGLATGPVGWVLAILMMAGPLKNAFDAIGKGLDNLGARGGLLGAVAKSLAFFARVLELLFAVIERIIRELKKGIGWLLDKSGLNKAGDKIGDFWDAGNRALDRATDKVSGKKKVEINVYGNANPTQSQEAMDYVAKNAAYYWGSGTSSVRVS